MLRKTRNVVWSLLPALLKSTLISYRSFLEHQRGQLVLLAVSLEILLVFLGLHLRVFLLSTLLHTLGPDIQKFQVFLTCPWKPFQCFLYVVLSETQSKRIVFPRYSIRDTSQKFIFLILCTWLVHVYTPNKKSDILQLTFSFPCTPWDTTL